MGKAFEAATAALADTPRPTLESFIAHAKDNFVDLAYMYGQGFVVHAVEIAEELLYKQEACGSCGMLYCECGEYE